MHREIPAQSAIDILLELISRNSHLDAAENIEQLEWQSDLALCYNNLGSIQSHLKNHPLACQLYRDAIQIQQELHRQAPATVRYRRELAVTWNNLGQAYSQQGNLDHSNQAFEQTQTIFQQLTQDYPDETHYQNSLAGTLNNQAMANEHLGQLDSALAIYDAATSLQTTVVELAPNYQPYRENLNKQFNNYSRALLKAEQPEKLAEIARQRSRFWPTHGQILYQSSQQLLQAAELLDIHPETDSQKQHLVDEALENLQKALAATEQPVALPIQDYDFQYVKNDPRFKSLFNAK